MQRLCVVVGCSRPVSSTQVLCAEHWYQREDSHGMSAMSESPRESESPKDISKGIPDADYMEVPESIDVYSWSPAPPGTKNAKCTQVHLHFGAPPGPVFFVRFKSPRTLDKIIAALQEHRKDVWG
jgi:hypothetical protein